MLTFDFSFDTKAVEVSMKHFADKAIADFMKSFYPEKVIFNSPATIVYWSDGTKTVSKVAEGEPFVEETGFMACVMKKMYGTRSAYLRIVESAYRQPKK